MSLVGGLIWWWQNLTGPGPTPKRDGGWRRRKPGKMYRDQPTGRVMSPSPLRQPDMPRQEPWLEMLQRWAYPAFDELKKPLALPPPRKPTPRQERIREALHPWFYPLARKRRTKRPEPPPIPAPLMAHILMQDGALAEPADLHDHDADNLLRMTPGLWRKMWLMSRMKDDLDGEEERPAGRRARH